MRRISNAPSRMPGHIGTSIISNSRKIQNGTDSDQLSATDLLATRQRLKGLGVDTAPMTNADIQKIALDRALCAFGLSPKELGMNKHVVRPTSVIDWSTSVVGGVGDDTGAVAA